MLPTVYTLRPWAVSLLMSHYSHSQQTDSGVRRQEHSSAASQTCWDPARLLAGPLPRAYRGCFPMGPKSPLQPRGSFFSDGNLGEHRENGPRPRRWPAESAQPLMPELGKPAGVCTEGGAWITGSPALSLAAVGTTHSTSRIDDLHVCQTGTVTTAVLGAAVNTPRLILHPEHSA